MLCEFKYPGDDGKTYYCVAKVYKKPSKIGINGGRVSKMAVSCGDRLIYHYDRGIDVKPARGCKRIVKTLVTIAELMAQY